MASKDTRVSRPNYPEKQPSLFDEGIPTTAAPHPNLAQSSSPKLENSILIVMAESTAMFQSRKMQHAVRTRALQAAEKVAQELRNKGFAVSVRIIHSTEALTGEEVAKHKGVLLIHNSPGGDDIPFSMPELNECFRALVMVPTEHSKNFSESGYARLCWPHIKSKGAESDQQIQEQDKKNTIENIANFIKSELQKFK